MSRPQESARTGPTYQLAEFLNRNWDEKVGRTNDDVAMELGYKSSNIISMWRTGRTRIPLDKLPDLARLMKLNLADLLPMCLEQQWGDRPDCAALSERIKAVLVTDAEAELIKVVRNVRPHPKLRFSTAELAAVSAALSA
jgi:hypothetical protein